MDCCFTCAIFSVLIFQVGSLWNCCNSLVVGLLISLTLRLLQSPDMTPSSTTGVELLTIFVTDLTTTPSTTELTTLSISMVEIRTDDTFVQLGTVDIFHAIECIRVMIVLDKAKSTGGLLVTVQTHDDTLDLATFGKELIDLLLCREEGEISNVESGRVGKVSGQLGRRALVLLVFVGGGD